MTTESFANDNSNQGTTGAQGPHGEKGPAGPKGPSDYAGGSFNPASDNNQGDKGSSGNELQQQVDVMQKRLTDKDAFIDTLKTENQQFRERMADVEAKLQSMGSVEEAVARMQEANNSNQDTTLDEDKLIDKALDKFKRETAAESAQRIAKENFEVVSETLTKTYGADKVDEVVRKAAEESGMSFEDMIGLAERSPKAVYKMVGLNQASGTASPSQSTNVGYGSDNLTKEQKLAHYSKMRRENPKEYYKPETQKAFRELCLSK